jgi:hypothetical protein
MWTRGWWRPPAVTGAGRRNLPEDAHLWISPGPEVALLETICEKKTLGSARSHGAALWSGSQARCRSDTVRGTQDPGACPYDVTAAETCKHRSWAKIR